MKIKLKKTASKLEKQIIKQFNKIFKSADVSLETCFHSGDTGINHSFSLKSSEGNATIRIDDNDISIRNFIMTNSPNWSNISMVLRDTKHIIIDGEKFESQHALYLYVQNTYNTLHHVNKYIDNIHIDGTADNENIKKINQYLHYANTQIIYGKIDYSSTIKLFTAYDKSELFLSKDGTVKLEEDYGRTTYIHKVDDIYAETSTCIMKTSYNDMFNVLYNMLKNGD